LALTNEGASSGKDRPQLLENKREQPEAGESSWKHSDSSRKNQEISYAMGLLGCGLTGLPLKLFDSKRHKKLSPK
jgi:hypothetical protein